MNIKSKTSLSKIKRPIQESDVSDRLTQLEKRGLTVNCHVIRELLVEHLREIRPVLAWWLFFYPWGGECSTNVYTSPVVQPVTLLYTIFLQKRFPFRILSIDKWYPFHMSCLELCIPFDCRKCTVYK